MNVLSSTGYLSTIIGFISSVKSTPMKIRTLFYSFTFYNKRLLSRAIVPVNLGIYNV